MGGATRILVGNDSHRLGERAIGELEPHEFQGASVKVIPTICVGRRIDTACVVADLLAEGTDVLLVMGGDGTCRDVAKAAPTVTMLGVAAGTNNVFPERIDETLAGLCAALVATGAVSKDLGTFRAKAVRVRCEVRAPVNNSQHNSSDAPLDKSADGEFEDSAADAFEDVALVDLAVLDESFTGARAVTTGRSIRLLVTAFAEPSSIGLVAIGAMVQPIGRRDSGGLAVHLDQSDEPLPGSTVCAVIAPGKVATFGFHSVTSVSEHSGVSFVGPAVLAFDGERDRTITAAQHCTAYVVSDGPTVIDVLATLRAAAAAGLMVRTPLTQLLPRSTPLAQSTSRPLPKRGRHAR